MPQVNLSEEIIILGIESSCDETAAAVLVNGKVISNIIATQEVHFSYGGVVPELASREHQKNIVPVITEAIKKAGIDKSQINAIAFTQGPGLLGSLLVGASFAKAFALALKIPLISIDHMQAHVLSHFIGSSNPSFPFLCLTVSGGHTQIVLVESHASMKIIGETMDDAAGEAFDKTAKLLNLPYPGGPWIDKLAALGNPLRFVFPHPVVEGFNFSFSGLKTSILYFLKENEKKNPDFIEENEKDLCASIQHTIVSILMKKLAMAAESTGITEIAIAGGVSVNSGLRKALHEEKEKRNWNIYIAKPEYCTDNAAMIAMAGYYKYINNDFASQHVSALARIGF